MTRRRRRRNPLAPLFNECTGAQAEQISEYVRLITEAFVEERDAWHKSLDGIFRQARYCSEANQELPDEDKEELIARLPFDDSRFRKLSILGRDQRLQNPDIRALLPPHHSTLYELTKLDDKELEEAVATKVIHQEMRRGQLATWLKARRDEEREGNQKGLLALPKGINWAIRFPEDKSDDDLSYFQEMLDRLCVEHGAELIYSKSYYEAGRREEIRYIRRVDAYMRREARRVIREMKKGALKGKPRHVNGRVWKQRWPFTPDETEIDGKADIDRIEYVLDILGMYGEFERMRDEAFSKA